MQPEDILNLDFNAAFIVQRSITSGQTEKKGIKKKFVAKNLLVNLSKHF